MYLRSVTCRLSSTWFQKQWEQNITKYHGLFSSQSVVWNIHKMASEIGFEEGTPATDGLGSVVSISTTWDACTAKATATSFHSRSYWDLRLFLELQNVGLGALLLCLFQYAFPWTGLGFWSPPDLTTSVIDMSVSPHNVQHMVLPLVYQYPAQFVFLYCLGLYSLYWCPLCPSDFSLSLNITLVSAFLHLPDRVFHHSTCPRILHLW